VGRELHSLVQSALRAGKRVHHETGIDRSGASLASLGLDRAEEWIGPLAHRAVVVVGAGSMGALVASRARKRSVAELTVVNRGLEAARRVDEANAGRAVALADRNTLRVAIAAADLLVSVTGSAGPSSTRPDPERAPDRWSSWTWPYAPRRHARGRSRSRRDVPRYRLAARRRPDRPRRATWPGGGHHRRRAARVPRRAAAARCGAHRDGLCGPAPSR
jgi:hypothetical protein